MPDAFAWDWSAIRGQLDPHDWPPTARAVAGAIAALAVTFLAYRAVSRGLGVAERSGRLPAAVAFALRWVAVVVAAVWLLQVVGVFESVFAAVAGVLTFVAAGFVAFWSVLSNLLCALILLVARPFQLGDRLSFPVEGLSGTVSDFNLLFTVLRTDDGRLLSVPNNLFFQKMFLRETGARTAELAESLEALPPAAR